MSKKNKQQALSWDAFQSLGNPENAPDLPKEESSNDSSTKNKQRIRVLLDKKRRGGKSVTLIKGLDESEEYISELGKRLKKICGVGGSAKNGEVIVQGDHRDKVIQYLIEQGYTDCKKSGG